jgi:DNA modification methylase
MIIQGDARWIPLKANSVDCVVTSPPYFSLRDYGHELQIGLESNPWSYVEEMCYVGEEIRRVLKPSGTFWLNLGDSYINSDNRTGTPKDNRTNTENRELKRKLSKMRRLKKKDLIGVPWLVAFALRDCGWYLRSEVVWVKPSAAPEWSKDRVSRAHETIFMLTKRPNYYYAYNKDVAEDSPHLFDRKDMGTQLGLLDPIEPEVTISDLVSHSVWIMPTAPGKGLHYAQFPPELVRRCIAVGCPKGGTVFDPFVGSGTTVSVAQAMGRVGIGMDLGYQKVAKEKIAGELFSKLVNSDELWIKV